MPRTIKFARGDFLKKYAPGSLYNTDPNAREIRDAVLAPKKRRGEAMIRADIKTNLSGKHTEHRNAIQEMEGVHKTRQDYLKAQGLTAQANKEDVTHRAAVANKESEYTDKYLGKNTPQSAGRGVVRRKIPKSQIQAATTQSDTFARSMAGELHANASVMRSARIATGAKPSSATNQRLVTVLPGLKKMVNQEVKSVMSGDQEKAGKLRARVEVMARQRIGARVKNPEVLDTRVRQVTEPLFKPGAVGGSEKDVFDAPSIGKKLGISPRTVEGIHRSHSKLIGIREPFVKGARDWKGERVADVTKRVLQKGNVFSPLRSAMHAKQGYPFLARNVGRIGGAATAGAVVAGGATALLLRKLRKKKEATQFSVLQFARGDRFQKLLAEAAGMGIKEKSTARIKIIQDRLNSASPGLRRTLAEKRLAGDITPAAHVSMMRVLGGTRKTLARNVSALRRTSEREGVIQGYKEKIGELTTGNEKLTKEIRSQAGRHGVEKRRIETAATESAAKAAAAHQAESDQLRQDVRDVRRIGRDNTRRAIIVGSATGVGAGGAAGYGAGRKKKESAVQFDVARVGTVKHDKVFSDGTRIDVQKLNKLVQGRKAREVEISSLNGLSKSKKSGYSEKRLKGARTSKPILITSKRDVVDGRHRCIKKKMKGDTVIKAIRVTKKDLKMVRFAIQDNRRHPTAGHDVAVGAIEGGLGVLATDRLIHKLVPSGSGFGRKIAIGAGVGGAATGAVGYLLSKLGRKRRPDPPVNFAAPYPPISRTRVTTDRYIKNIYETDQDRAERNYARTAISGGLIGSLLRNKKTTPLGKAAAIGAGAGLAVQAATRIGTSKSRDQFGDRTYGAKRIDRVPSMIGAATVGGILANRVRKRIKKVRDITHFDDEFDRKLKRIARNPEARGEEIYRNVNRARRIVRDINNPGRVDSRGRPTVPEWQKPWVKKAVGIGALAISVRKGVGAIRSLRATAAAQKAVSGSAHGIAGVLDAGESFFKKPGPGVRSPVEKFMRAHREISRPLLRIRNEVKGIKRDTGDLINNKTEDVFRRWSGKGTPAAQQAVAAVKRKGEIESVKEKLKVVRDNPAPTTEPGKKRKPGMPLTQFAEVIPDWDLRDARGRSARVYAPGSQRRIRRSKTPFERIDTERKVRDAVAVGTLVTGAVGTHLVHKKIEANRIAAQQPEFKDVPGHPGLRETISTPPPDVNRAAATLRRRVNQASSAKTAKAVKDVLKKLSDATPSIQFTRGTILKKIIPNFPEGIGGGFKRGGFVQKEAAQALRDIRNRRAGVSSYLNIAGSL